MLQNFFFWTKRLLGVRKDKYMFSVTHVLHIRHSLWQVNLDLLFIFSWIFFLLLLEFVYFVLFKISAQKKFMCVYDPNTYLTFVQTKQKKETELGCYFRKLSWRGKKLRTYNGFIYTTLIFLLFCSLQETPNHVYLVMEVRFFKEYI